MSATITATPAVSGPCSGCEYQVFKGQRKATNVLPANYLCDHCFAPLCKGHIQYEERGDWWLCAKCLTAFERKAGLR